MSPSPLQHISPTMAVYLLLFLPLLWAFTMEELEKEYVRGDYQTPCFYFDTINITDAPISSDHYMHKGQMISDIFIGAYNATYDDSGTAYPAEPHLRACICEFMGCINLCCPFGQKVHSNSSDTLECIDFQPASEYPRLVNVTDEEGEENEVDAFEAFDIVHYRDCDAMYIIDPTEDPEDGYTLFSDGDMMLVDELYLSQYDYCMVPYQSEATGKYALRPAICGTVETVRTIKVVIAYLLLFSIPFILATIVVYLVIPELRTRHGKSLVCYLLCLVVVNFTFALNTLDTTSKSYSTGCYILGYTGYYCFLAALFWLNVISFDLWHSFRGTRGVSRDKDLKRFIMYSVYAWTLPMIILLISWYIDDYAEVKVDFQPDFGLYCFVNTETGWSGLIYFIAPLLIITVANIIMFIMTAVKIHRVQREMSRIMAKEDSTRNLNKEKDKFGLFLRLFIVMGVTWFMDVVSYFVPEDSKWAKVLYLSDVFNAIQGFVIFVLFVMKRKVKKMIVNRFPSIFKGKKQRESEHSMRTTYSSAGNSDLSAEKPLMKPKQRVTSLS